MTSNEKTKAVAVCSGCDQPLPVRIWPNGYIHPIGGHDDCSGDGYQILESSDGHS